MGFLALLVVSCGNPTTGAGQSPSPIVPVTTATTASLPPTEVVHQATVRGTYQFDFERGVETGSSTADVWWEQVDSTHRFLVPTNGAALALIRGVSFENTTQAVLAAQRYSVLRLDGSDGPSNVLTPGAVVAIRTHDRRLVKMLVNSEGYDLGISWVTFA